MTAPRILFVDDEPHILEGLRNRLRRFRHRWEMGFAYGGAQALDVLHASPFDVIVTDMRMPGVDGSALLEAVRRNHPEVVRIVLSGHSELESARRTIPAAHQFLAKPCDEGVLENVIARALSLRALIGDERVRRIAGQIDSLPAMPATYAKVRAKIADEKSSTADVAAVIRLDPTLCAKLLQMVNSAFFGLSRTVSKVEDAVAYLGLERTAGIVLAGELFALAPVREGAVFSVDELQRHSLATATAAAALLPTGAEREDAYMAALLHDVGKLILAVHLPEHLERALTEAAASSVTLQQAETRLFGVTHAEIGAYLLGLWGLPHFIVEAVANHHAPARVANASLGVLGAVHVADSLDHAKRGERFDRPDAGYLSGLGVPEGQWERWLEAHQRAPERAP